MRYHLVRILQFDSLILVQTGDFKANLSTRWDWDWSGVNFCCRWCCHLSKNGRCGGAAGEFSREYFWKELVLKCLPRNNIPRALSEGERSLSNLKGCQESVAVEVLARRVV